jgi:hypothetical protein
MDKIQENIHNKLKILIKKLDFKLPTDFNELIKNCNFNN